MLRNFTLPKGSNDEGAVFKVRYMSAAVSTEGLLSDVYVDFTERVMSSVLLKRFRGLGVYVQTMMAFGFNDRDLASSCLVRIWELSEASQLYSCGKCPTDLLAITRIKYNMNQSMKSSSSEFDVVKKRQRMEASEENFTDNIEALARFKEFEDHTLPALLFVHANDLEDRARELAELEEDLQEGKLPRKGGVYFARSKSVAALKIGATRRSEPGPRLYELSRCVPDPFQLVAWVPTMSPFKLEREVHAHFQQYRIRTRGACTEFFSVDDVVASVYAQELFKLT